MVAENAETTNESNEETPDTSAPDPAKAAAADKARQARLGKGKPKAGETRWDNVALDPNQRKSIAEDPEGKGNVQKKK